MISIELQALIFRDYHDGKDHTTARKYLYTLQYNPMSLMHTWIIRKPKTGGEWEWVQPLASNLQFTPRNSTRKQ